ncbi:hypothetical protein J2W55_001812 [Mucilaginibacter pocheonensis]|uniref:Uncharacterized protein n=1 Tax=Mucilaginibacter pocheonensis TaxID=398050 RepID=A0ABU1TAU0_9SPHI|nr:hypothetical protein [Mucilaginibacter pocheonensis]
MLSARKERGKVFGGVGLIAKRVKITPESTHPGYATLGDPLYGFAIKRVEEIIVFCI